MMRLTTVALVLWGGTALAQEPPASAALRSIAGEAAVVTAIKKRCPSHIGVDTGFTEALQGTILMDGIRQVGKEPFMRIVKAEQARVRADIERSGPAAWCRRQKALLQKPYPDVFRP